MVLTLIWLGCAAPPSKSMPELNSSPQRGDVSDTDGVVSEAEESTRPGLESKDAKRNPVAARPDPVRRFPNMEAPETVQPGQELAVLVSLTRSSLGTGTRVLATHPDLATTEEEGGEAMLALNLGEGDLWKLSVVLSAPDFIPIGTVAQDLYLPRVGDSTPAVFRLKVPEGMSTPVSTTLNALFSHEGRFVARVARDIQILRPGEAASTPDEEARPVAPVVLERPEAPDLVIIVHGGASGTRTITYLLAGTHNPAIGRQTLPADFQQVLGRHYRSFQDVSARSLVPVDAPVKRQAARDLAIGLGRDLAARPEWRPEGFDAVFWSLKDALGDDFDTIEVVTDDPVWPWELMRPSRTGPDGYQESPFLGTAFRVSRWHLSGSSRQRGELDLDARLQVDHVTAVAPTYAPPLTGQADELSVLAELPGYRRAAGTYAGVRQLFVDPPGGIVHFAGHGVVASEAGVGPQFSILLDGGERFDARQVRGLGEPGARHGVFYFFNACEVGAAQASGGFVEGWPAAVLDGGADGFVGALWPVGDVSAARFARSFYGELQQGGTEGALVAEALRASRARFEESGDPTWLAYVMYGDPSLRVVWGAP